MIAKTRIEQEEMFWRVFVNRTRSIIQRLIPLGSKGEAVVKALAFHWCGPGSSPAVDAKCGLSLTLFFPLPREVFRGVLNSKFQLD